jgi:hypothetical protein
MIREKFSNRDITLSSTENILSIPNERADRSFNEKLDKKTSYSVTNKSFILSI